MTISKTIIEKNSVKKNHETLNTIILGKKGAETTVRIIDLLFKRPLNINQIAEQLGMHYNTASYHVNLLLESILIKKEGGNYGAIYLPAKLLKENIHTYNKLKAELLKK